MPNWTSLQNRLATSDLVADCTYFDGASSFFANFGAVWRDTKYQVLKLETRQEYQQPDNESYVAFTRGDLRRSMQLLDESVAGDRELYASLRDRGVDFIRCRPISKPMSPYLAWEMQHYEFNSREGERIYCCDLNHVGNIFDQRAKHDFMVFDSSVAVIHNYDSSGGIAGGWMTRDEEKISILQSLFIEIKSHCSPFTMFFGA